MDEPTKLSPKLLAGLLKLLKSQTGGADPTPEEGRDENPLDSPGDGGFTPVCNENPQEEI